MTKQITVVESIDQGVNIVVRINEFAGNQPQFATINQEAMR